LATCILQSLRLVFYQVRALCYVALGTSCHRQATRARFMWPSK